MHESEENIQAPIKRFAALLPTADTMIVFYWKHLLFGFSYAALAWEARPTLKYIMVGLLEVMAHLAIQVCSKLQKRPKILQRLKKKKLVTCSLYPFPNDLK